MKTKIKKCVKTFFKKKMAAAIFASAAAFSISVDVHAQYVHTNGTKIVDANGNQLYMSGMNLGNWLVWEGYLMMGDYNYRTHTQFFNSLKNSLGGFDQAMAFEREWRLNYVTEKTIQELSGLGFNSIRVPFNYKLFWYNGAVSDAGFEYIDRLVSYCRNNHVYILLDMHGTPGYQNPGDHSDNGDSSANQNRGSVKFWDGNNVDIAAQVWRHIANHYKNEPVIWGYDLVNEPVPQDGREYELLPSMVRMRNAIREVDNNHTIVAEGSWWGSDMSKIDWSDSNTQSRTGINNRWDNNLVYETHHYVGGNAAAIGDLNGRVDTTNRLGIPLILGEYGEDSPQILRQMTDWSIQRAAGYFPWSFKKMFHDKTLWTVQSNGIYDQVRNSINSGEWFVNGGAQGMVDFARNNIANGAPGLQWHDDFYQAVRPLNIIKSSSSSSTNSSSSSSSSSSGSFTKQIEAESFTAMSGVQTENTSDTNGGQNVGWIDAGDWMAFANITFPTSGTYRVEYRVASPSGSSLSLDLNWGTIQLGQLPIPATGGWQNWQTISQAVTINAGTYSVGVYAQQSGWNLNWIKFTKL